jgi:sodium transport system permease protein
MKGWLRLPRGSDLHAAWVVFRKELLDALRDRRTLFMVVLSSVAVGPLVLFAMSFLVADIEARAERRDLLVAGAEHAPTLVNFLARQTYRIEAAPPDHEARLRDGSLREAVLVIAPGFEAALARGEAPLVEVVYSGGKPQAQGEAARVQRLLEAFEREQAVLRLALSGVSPQVLEVVRAEPRDLASPATRAAQLTGILPFFVLMAVLYGALNAALDTTAGERERGSLEPLLMNPASRAALVAGKWGAVASVGMLIALLSCFSFLPAQWLLRSEMLAAMFQFGLREAALFMVLLAPLAAALSAVMMAIAIRCRTFKEAQADNTLVILVVSLLPLVTLLDPGGASSAWQTWVPALGQVMLMTQVLKGEPLGLLDLAGPFAVCVLLTAACVASVAHSLRRAAVR